jgi:hypothetical protein
MIEKKDKKGAHHQCTKTQTDSIILALLVFLVPWCLGGEMSFYCYFP